MKIKNNLVVSAHQPAFLPWLGYIEKFALSDIFIVMDIAKFRKRAFMHRNKIEINNKPHFLGFHLEKNADSLNCDKIYINKNFSDDLSIISNKIKNTYKKSKFYNEVELFCNECLTNDINSFNLVEICLKQLKYFKKIFNFETKIMLESEIIESDYLSKINTSQRLLQHALKLSAKIYITGINSESYLDKEIFEDHNIFNYVQKFDYSPFFEIQTSQECLSIIHQIALIGVNRVKEILNKNIQNKKEILQNEISKKNKD